MNAFDVAVIGAGPGGYIAALRSARNGLRTAVIEKEGTLGGTCLNVGCIPSKALLDSSGLYHEALHSFSEHGIHLESSTPRLDLPSMMQRKDRIVAELTGGIGSLIDKSGITHYRARGSLAGDHRIELHGDDVPASIEAEHIVLALGSAPVELSFMPFDKKRVISSTEALSLDAVPEKLVVVGAGAIGLELGSVWARLGSQVTVVELLPQIAPHAEKQLAKALERSLKKIGMSFMTGAQVGGADIHESSVTLHLEDKNGKPQELSCDKVLVAVGRRPFTEDAGLAKVGIEIDTTGFIPVDDQLRSNLSHVFAIGDCCPGPMLAHKAEEEGAAVADIIAGRPGHVDHRLVPNVIYTEPELAQVGKREDELQAEGLPIEVGKSYFKANGRAKCLGLSDGLVKVIRHAETDTLLGVHILGPRASDLIAEAAMAMRMGAGAHDLAQLCHAHPTLAESLKHAAQALFEF